ncbi:MAG: hypothetical protein JNJ88_18170 [Planctomycetes bacterium]|nr:hypothetical protein [Planctomycetota bacterium]
MNSISDAPKFQPRAENAIGRAIRRVERKSVTLHKNQSAARETLQRKGAVEEALIQILELGNYSRGTLIPDSSRIAKCIVALAKAWQAWSKRPPHERIRKLPLTSAESVGREIFASTCKKVRSGVPDEVNILATEIEIQSARMSLSRITSRVGGRANFFPHEFGILTFFRMLNDWLDRPLLAQPSRAEKPKVLVAGSSSKATMTTKESTPDANDTITSAHPRADQRSASTRTTNEPEKAADGRTRRLTELVTFAFGLILSKKQPMTAAEIHTYYVRYSRLASTKLCKLRTAKRDLSEMSARGFLEPRGRKGYRVVKLPPELEAKLGQLFARRPKDWRASGSALI